MVKIKEAGVAGLFYPKTAEEIKSFIKNYGETNKKVYPISTRAIIAPHAGYVYSGQIAAEAIQYLDEKVKNIFIIAPAHRVETHNIVLSSYDEWNTPLGNIKINQEINQKLIDKYKCEIDDSVFEPEHSVEVQIPFIQTKYQQVNIIPILVGAVNDNRIMQIINEYYSDESNAFIISSDLSHFNKSEEAKKIDTITANMIENLDVSAFKHNQACGALGIAALVNFAASKNYSLIRVRLRNSGDITGENESVVGYGAWIMAEESKTKFLKNNYADLIHAICVKTLIKSFDTTEIDIDREFPNLPNIFAELGACFVTLNKNGKLRGCVGSIVAHQQLVVDLMRNTYNAAFMDNRFEPLKKEELNNLTLKVSLLSNPVKMTFEDEMDLLNKIRPYVDGLIIRDGNYQAVYLPSVWEELPNKIDFLRSLKVKAGMEPDHFSDTFEAYRFTAELVGK